MALRQCLSEGKRAVLANIFPRNLTNSQCVIGVRLSSRTQPINITNTCNSHRSFPKFYGLSWTKWQYFTTQSCCYSKIHDFSDDGDKKQNLEEGERIRSELRDVFRNKQEMTNSEWKETIDLMCVGFHVNEISYSTRIMELCMQCNNYRLATSFLEHLHHQGQEPNLSTLGCYLEMCGRFVSVCGEDKVFDVYHKLMSRVKILDGRLGLNVIAALTATSKWRQALDHLPQLRKINAVSAAIHSTIVTAAFRAGDYEMGWQFLKTMRQHEQSPQVCVFLEWIRQCEAQEDRAAREAMAFTILEELEGYPVYPSVAVIETLTQFFRDSLGWSAHYTKMSASGVCPACHHNLEVKQMTQEEFKLLQEEFVPRVLVQSDIFRSSTPEEWQNFRTFVEENKPFSMVVDGLNASYRCQKKPREKNLKDVVDQALMHSEDRVLVMGRKHMSKWSSVLRTYSPSRVLVYNLDNMSKDDGFFLYAALQSGLGSMFVTNDMLRNHIYLLGDEALRLAFRKWQNTHQLLSHSSGESIRFLLPPKFSTVAQSSRDGGVVRGWHIPYDDGTPRSSFQVPSTWLCLHPSLNLPACLPRMVSRKPVIGNTHFDKDNTFAVHHNRVISKASRVVGNRGKAHGISQQNSNKHQRIVFHESGNAFDKRSSYRPKETRYRRKGTEGGGVKSVNVSKIFEK